MDFLWEPSRNNVMNDVIKRDTVTLVEETSRTEKKTNVFETQVRRINENESPKQVLAGMS